MVASMTDVPGWFAAAMVALAEAYPSFHLREGTVRATYLQLAHLPQGEVELALRRAPQEYRSFFPSAGDLLGLLVPSPDDQGLVFWDGLSRAPATVGAYQTLECPAAVAAAVRTVFGSWPEFCAVCQDVPTGPWLAKRQEFLAAYRMARRALAGRDSAIMVRLPGLLEYDTGSEVWVGRLGASGEVESRRDRPALTTGRAVPKLTTGESNDELL